MKKGKYETVRRQRSKLWLWLLTVGCLLLLLCWMYNKALLTSESDLPLTETLVEKDPHSIAIPGYEGIELAANSKKQSIQFSNPSQNSCYFQLILCLEDGTQLWKSALVAPGKLSDRVVLSQELEKGTYSNAVLIYNCYAMDENRTPLNGAETKLALWVK